MPPAFLDMTLADNNLETSERSETARSGLPFYGEIDPAQVGETVIATLSVARFATPSGQATFGGGERADLSFDGGERGSLENVPHGAVHSLVGNDYDEFGNVLNAGWMGSFFTAGLDPLFWLHHANIDRLWEVWLRLDPAHVNPTGDPAFFDTTFTFPDPETGSVTWSVGEVLDTEFLGYVYESMAAPAVLAPPTPEPPEDTRSASTEGSMSRSTPPQVLGAANDVPLAGPEPVAVDMERPQRPRGPEGEPARAYLRVEGVTGTSAAPLYGVYLNVPEGEDPHDHPELRAGSFSTFGLVETSQTNEQHSGEGLTASFDITDVRDRLARAGPVGRRPGAGQLQHRGPGHAQGRCFRVRESDAARPDVRARRIAIMVD